jgi:hypothetical protein
MRVEGRWHRFQDTIIRPIIEAKVQTSSGNWEEVAFLLDSGADRTVLEARFLPLLDTLAVPEEDSPQLGGVGGNAECLFVQTRLAFTRDDGKSVTVNGAFGVFTDATSSDISILGRDVTNNFDVIYSYPQREVLLLAAPHTYSVQLPF